MSFISAGNTTTTTLLINGDTTGNLVFNTGGANTTALTLTNTQGANFAGSVSSLNTFGFKNRVINGAMVIDQRNAGASVTATATSTVTYTLDRWAYVASVASKYTVQQNAGSVTPPTGFTNYLGITSLSAYTPLAASDNFNFQQNIEGLNVSDLAWGTANAKTITLSFWVRSSLTGAFGGALRNSASDRSYLFSYTINSANTWEQKSITIAGDTTGTWLTTNGIGIKLIFGLGVGSTSSGTANTWQAGSYIAPTGSTSVVGTNGATFYITGVQLEVGTQATSFDFRDYGRELMLCQRYYAKTFPLGTVPAQAASQNGCLISVPGAGTTNGSGYNCVWRFPVAMRSAPTIALYTPSASGGGNWYDAFGGSTTTSGATNTSEFSTIVYNISSLANPTANGVIHATASIEL